MKPVVAGTDLPTALATLAFASALHREAAEAIRAAGQITEAVRAAVVAAWPEGIEDTNVQLDLTLEEVVLALDQAIAVQEDAARLQDDVGRHVARIAEQAPTIRHVLAGGQVDQESPR